LKLETEYLAGPASPGLLVRLDRGRRLILTVSDATEPIQRKGAELARVFQVLHELAEDADRVALVTNIDAARRPAERAAAFTPDALTFLTRLGVSHVAAPTLFALWKLGLVDPSRARAQLERLYDNPAGTFELQASLKR
jgi:hypothetical protein